MVFTYFSDILLVILERIASAFALAEPSSLSCFSSPSESRISTGSCNYFKSCDGKILVKKILHYRFIFLIINSVCIAKLHRLSDLGEHNELRLISAYFITWNSFISFFRVYNNSERFSEFAKTIVKILTKFLVLKLVLVFIGIAFVPDADEKITKLRICFTKFADYAIISTIAPDKSAPHSFQDLRAVHIHSSIKFLNQSTIVYNKSIIFAFVKPVCTCNSL